MNNLILRNVMNNLIRVRDKNLRNARQKAWQFGKVIRGKTVTKPIGGFGIFDFEVKLNE